jgi:hypothetical protein
MFVGDELMMDVSFTAARSRLASLAERGVLLSTAQDAFSRGDGTRTTRVGPAGLSKLVRVQAHELTETDDCAGLAIRWEATGPGGGLFPVLDADLRLTPAGNMTLLTLTGAYRPPLGSFGELLDRAALHRIAAATIRNFLSRVAAGITGHNGPAEAAAAGAGPSLPPAGPG